MSSRMARASARRSVPLNRIRVRHVSNAENGNANGEKLVPVRNEARKTYARPEESGSRTGDSRPQPRDGESLDDVGCLETDGQIQKRHWGSVVCTITRDYFTFL